MFKRLLNKFKRMPEDDISKKIIKKLRNKNIRVDRQIIVTEEGSKIIRTWEYNFTINELKSKANCSLIYDSDRIKLTTDYKLSVDNLVMRCKKRYIKIIVDILDNIWFKSQDEDNDLIRKDIRNILNQN